LEIKIVGRKGKRSITVGKIQTKIKRNRNRKMSLKYKTIVNHPHKIKYKPYGNPSPNNSSNPHQTIKVYVKKS
jgi:hypothetical protein